MVPSELGMPRHRVLPCGRLDFQSPAKTPIRILSPYSTVLLEKLTGFAANQEIPRILWNPKVHYHTHERPPTVPVPPIRILLNVHACISCKGFSFFVRGAFKF